MRNVPEKFVLVIVTALLTMLSVFAQLPKKANDTGFKLEKSLWTVKEGLPDWKIYSFLMDHNNLMWFSSAVGLFTFDGNDFNLVIPDSRFNKQGHVAYLFEDREDKIWFIRLANRKVEIEIFDPETGQLMSAEEYTGSTYPGALEINFGDFIAFEVNGEIWIELSNSILKYDGEWRIMYEGETIEGMLWYPAGEGIWIIDKMNKKLKLANRTEGLVDEMDLPDDFIYNQLFFDEYDRLFLLPHISTPIKEVIASEIQIGTGRINVGSRKLSANYPWRSFNIFDVFSANFARFGYLFYWNADQLYLGSTSGSFNLNLEEDYPDFKISHINYVDRHGGIWYSGPEGLTRWEVQVRAPFTTYLKESPSRNSTRGMVQRGDTLYVASYSGARKIDLTSGEDFPLEYPGSKLTHFIKCDDKGLWMGTEGYPEALVRLSNNGQIRTFILPREKPEANDMVQIGAGKWWLATDNGIEELDETTGHFKSIALKDTTAIFIYENAEGFWVGTSNGLFLLDKDGKVKDRFLASGEESFYQRLTHIYDEKNGVFWITSSGGGLIRLDTKSRKVLQFTTADGLPHNNLHAVYADSRGILWISSDNGLINFNLNTYAISSFFKRDGLADDELNFLSHYRSPDGRLFFGGVNGLTSLDPNRFPVKLINSLDFEVIEARTLNIDDNTYNYQFEFGREKRDFFLRPDDSFLELKLSTLKYEVNNKNVYAWRIIGLQTEWVQQNEPIIRLSNLDYGTHKLEIKVFSMGNQPEGPGRVFTLHVIRPYYLRYPFIFGVLLLALLSGVFISRWRTRNVFLENKRLEQLVSLRTEELEKDKILIELQANDLLKLNQLKSRFFANLAHELRTPLTLILGPLESIIRGNIEPVKSMSYLMGIERNTLKLLNLIEEILDLSRLDENKIKLEVEAVQILPFLERLIKAYKPNADIRGVQVKLDYKCKKDLVLMIDSGKSEKVVNNLLGNAIKFTSEGGKVEVSFEKFESGYLLQVKDTGVGIPEKDLPYIFDRFYQVETGRRGGVGIGLALCKEYCDLMGSKIDVVNLPEKGSNFRVFFEAEELTTPFLNYQSKAFLSSEAEADSRIPTQVISKKQVVLVVEDEPEILAFLASTLQDHFIVKQASNGKQALEILGLMQVDLILSDLMMPEMDGIELLKNVKSKSADLPFILLTARSSSRDKLEALSLGVDDYLTKPFDTSELFARIDNLIYRYQLRRNFKTERTEEEGELEGFDARWVKQLEAVVKENLGNPLFSVSTLADELAMSERSLQYKTKEMVGLSPNQIVQEIRLKEALHMLESGAYPTVAEVCYAVGFKSTQYFASLMKKRFGKSPSDFLPG